MASLCRSAAAAVTRSAALRSRSSMARPFLAAPSPVSSPRIRRPLVAAALASLESLMPLHSAVAAARLRSCIAVDSACWSCLSQVHSCIDIDYSTCAWGWQHAAVQDDDPMLHEFQLAQASIGGSTDRPNCVSGGKATITFGPDVQLAAPEQASDEVNDMQINATPLDSTMGQSDSPVLADVDLAVMTSAAAAKSIVDEHADLQGAKDTGNCAEIEDIDGCASFCRQMFKKVPEPLLPRPASPLVADIQKKARRSRIRGRRTTQAPTRSSLRLAARPSSVPMAQRVQHKLMRELDFINGESPAPDAAIMEYVDSFGHDVPEQAVKAIRAAAKLDNKELCMALAAITAELEEVETEVP